MPSGEREDVKRYLFIGIGLLVIIGSLSGLVIWKSTSHGKTCEQALKDAYMSSLRNPDYQVSEQRPVECAGLSDEEYLRLAVATMGK